MPLPRLFTPATATTILLLGIPLANTDGMEIPDKPIPAAASPVFFIKSLLSIEL
jgi:hypothetical protein